MHSSWIVCTKIKLYCYIPILEIIEFVKIEVWLMTGKEKSKVNFWCCFILSLPPVEKNFLSQDTLWLRPTILWTALTSNCTISYAISKNHCLSTPFNYPPSAKRMQKLCRNPICNLQRLSPDWHTNFSSASLLQVNKGGKVLTWLLPECIKQFKRTSSAEQHSFLNLVT